jgi:hypothetical protein
MQNLLKNEKIIPLLKRRKSRDLADQISQRITEKKRKIEKIKILLKETKKDANTKELANEILKNFKETETNHTDILKKELNLQVENFKKKLELKKNSKIPNFRNRGCSLPHTRLYQMIKQTAEEIENLEKNNPKIFRRRGTAIKKSSTPPRKKSILGMAVFKEEDESHESRDSEETDEFQKSQGKSEEETTLNNSNITYRYLYIFYLFLFY